ncbi:MAG: molybdopterin cofactor-binding domain-containing protein [bacterium]
MNRKNTDPFLNPGEDVTLEAERYELFAEPLYTFDLSRRDFLKFTGGGILVLLALPAAEAAEAARERRRGSGGDLPREIGAWLRINEQGAVTVHTGKVEMGQNIRTSLTQAVAEELRVPVDAITLIMGDTDLTPYDAGTFGSRTTPDMSPRLRRVAATAREILLDLAAETWQVRRDSLKIADGRITHPESNRSAVYGELTQGKEITKTIDEDVPLTPAEQWRIAGASVPKIGGRDFVTGKQTFVSDMKLPGMLHAKILRPPAFGAELTSLDTKKAEALSGVLVVRDGNFVGVAAPSEETAVQALRGIQADWKTTPQPSRAELFEHLKKHASSGNSPFTTGSIADGLAAARQQLRETYTVDYIAHAPLEPRAALAVWEGEKLTVWTGTQRPFGVRSELARAFNIPEERVRVIMPGTGSGYGGKHTGDAAIEAARLARAAGKPVKLVWTREEEFTWAYFRPAGVFEIHSGVQADGTITAWEYHNYNSGAAAIRTMYDIPNQHIEFHSTDSPLRQGSYRALAATANHFARESFMDELAHAVKMDPLAFRLKNLKDERFINVLKSAAERFGWNGKKSTPERGFGLAGGFEKGSYVATCVEVAIDPSSGEVRVVHVVEAFECGAVINPRHLENQVEGMIMMGLGGALFESIDFANGKILNPRFSRYRVPRFDDVPVIATILLDRKDIPSAGGGETPIVGIAPAIGNAIFNATGKRLRALPLAPKGLKN